MRPRLSILIMFCVFAAAWILPAFAEEQSRVVEVHAQSERWLTEQIRILEPLPVNAGPEDAANVLRQGKWTWNGNSIINFAYTCTDLWLAFDYQADVGVVPVLRIAYSELDDVSVYVQGTESTRWNRLAHGGDMLPFVGQPISDRTVALRLPETAGGVKRVLVNVKGLALMKVPLVLSDEPTFSANALRESFADGIYFGVFGLVILINMFFYRGFRKQQYLEYSLFALGFGGFVAVYKGYDSVLFAQNQFQINNYNTFFFLYIASIFMIRFSDSFLHFSKRFSMGKPFIRWFTVGCALLFIGNVFGPYQMFEQLAAPVAMIAALYSVTMGVLMWRKNQFAKIYMSANLLFIGSIMVVALSTLNLIPAQPWMENVLQIGAFLQTMVLFIALINEIRVIQREKEMADAERIALQQQAQAQLAMWNQELKGKVDERTKSIQQLLDHSAEGFFRVTADLRIGTECSAECYRLFGDDFVGRQVGEILESEDAFQQKFLLNVLEDIFKTKDVMQQLVMISLLPEQLERDGLIIRMRYKWVEQNGTQPAHLLAMAFDITGELKLKQQMEIERQHFEMVIQVFTHSDEFIELMQGVESLLEDELPDWLGRLFTETVIYQRCFRTVHTLKGTASQMKVQSLASVLHALEEQLLSGSIEGDPVTMVRSAWETDLAIIHAWLGEKITREDSLVSIERKLLLDLRNRLMEHPTVWSNELIVRLEQYLYKTAQEMLAMMPAFVERIAQTLDKWIQPLILEGDSVRVDPERMQPFFKTLVHIFRNMIDHGIEPAEERLMNGKPEMGTIRCHVRKTETGFELTISDDGNGIRPELVRAKAIEKGMVTTDWAATASSAELIDLIWRDGFSTREVVTEISGRGIGLAAVKAEADRMGIHIQVDSRSGEGTSFRFLVSQA